MQPIAPMLATLADEPFHRPGWVYEEKYDGIRIVACRGDGGVQLFTRNLIDRASSYPDVAAALAKLPGGELVLDGEICVFDAQGVSRFGLWQHGSQAVFMAFDCLMRGGKSLLSAPLSERRAALEAVVPAADTGVLRRSRRLTVDGFAAYRTAQQNDWEGIIAKDEASAYEPGKRSRAWLKVKVRRESEFVIGGFTAPKGSRTHFGALLVGLYEGERLRYTGKVGTGFDAKLLKDLGARLEALKVGSAPFDPSPKERGLSWVQPKLVAQLGYAEWTGDGKLRHPTFLGMREDKRPEECTWGARE